MPKNGGIRIMFQTFEELHCKLRKYKGQVVSLDIKCPNCEKVTSNADTINVDEHLEDYETHFQFYSTHYFTCKNTCRREVRYSHVNVRKIKTIGTMQQQLPSLRPYLLVERGSLWTNSITNKMLFVEHASKINVFSNPLKKAFIHAIDLKDDLMAEYEKFDGFRNTAIKDDKYFLQLKEFILREYPSVQYPAFYDPFTKAEEGKVFDLDSLQFIELSEVPLAQYTSLYDIEAGHFYLDALSPNLTTDKCIFDKNVEIDITFLYKAFFSDSMKPRTLGQIVQSSDEQLVNKYIEFRLHPLYGAYVPVQITDTLPLMYQEDEQAN